MTADVQVIGISQAAVYKFFAKTAPAGDCVVWLGELDRDGYGRFRMRRGPVRQRWSAHRFAYLAMVGEILDGWHVDHVKARGCVHRACVLPDHLEAVTPVENHERWSQAIIQCPSGHDYDEENTGHHTSGARRCRRCDRERAQAARTTDPSRHRAIVRAYRARKRAAS